VINPVQDGDHDETAVLSRPSGVNLDSWQHAPPVLQGPGVTLREVRRVDAPALLTALSTSEVARFISPPPATIEGFEKFILSARSQRATGEAVCFSVIPAGYEVPVGVIQVRAIEPHSKGAEWGFALGREFWGEGLFYTAAPLVIDWVFDRVGVERLEARSATRNGRGNGALRKLGALQEAVLRQSLRRDDDYLDQVLWAITSDHWHALRHVAKLKVH
jgi:ribosomal-protein-alanine N-acetyltransferase